MKSSWPLLVLLTISSGLLWANPRFEEPGPAHRHLALDSHQAEQLQQVMRNHRQRFQPTEEERAYRQQELSAQVQQVLTKEQFALWQEQQQRRSLRARNESRSQYRQGRTGRSFSTQ